MRECSCCRLWVGAGTSDALSCLQSMRKMDTCRAAQHEGRAPGATCLLRAGWALQDACARTPRYTHIHTRTHARTHICTHTHTHIHTHMQHAHTHTMTHKQPHTCIRTHALSHTHKHTQSNTPCPAAAHLAAVRQRLHALPLLLQAVHQGPERLQRDPLSAGQPGDRAAGAAQAP